MEIIKDKTLTHEGSLQPLLTSEEVETLYGIYDNLPESAQTIISNSHDSGAGTGIHANVRNIKKLSI